MAQLAQIDIDLIDSNPNQPRTDLPNLEKLAESIRELGVALPIILTAATAPSTRYVLEDGHRRHAAAKLAGLTEVPAIVSESDSETVQLMRMMAFGTTSEPLSAFEEAGGDQMLIELGADIETIAKVTARTDDEVTSLVIARDFIKESDSEQITFDQMLAIAEFEFDEKRVRKLVKTAGTPDFDHTYSRMKREADLEAKVEASRKIVEEAGAKEIDSFGHWNRDLKNLVDENGVPITPEAHKDCPGHAAHICAHTGRISWYCLDEDKHERPDVSPSRSKETDEEKAEREKAEAERAARELAWDAATDVRLAWILENIIGKADPDPAMWKFCVDWAWEWGLHPKEEARNSDITDQFSVATAHLPRLFALVSLDAEGLFDDFSISRDHAIPQWWEGYLEVTQVLRYFALLGAIGYHLAECEKAILTGCEKALQEQKEAEAPVVPDEAESSDPGGCEGCTKPETDIDACAGCPHDDPEDA